MKAAVRILAAALLYLLAVPTFAQNNQPLPAPASAEGLLSGPQLEALVAPIALYPDPLLSEIMMASTYPLEIVAADRWVKSNANLQDDQLKGAVDQQPWDQSVKSLVATASVLDMMSNKLDWTQKLGDAVLAQQADVMDAVQRLRQRAQNTGKLKSTPQQTVTVIPAQTGTGQAPGGAAPGAGGAPAVQGGGQLIAIEPTDPDTLYVPYYDPAVVYGEWPYSDYQPYYFGYPGYIGAGIVATGLAFGGAYALGRWATNGARWGGGLNWRNNQINPLRSAGNINIGNNWVHNPAHRGGARYNNANVAQKFGGNRNVANRNLGNNTGGGQNRGNLAGRNGKGQPGAANRVSGGNRNGAGANQKRNTANAGKGTGNRTSANRAGGKRTNTANRAATSKGAGNRSAANRGSNRGASHARTTNAARSNAHRSSPGAGARHAGGGSMRGLHASAAGGGFRGAGGGMRGGGMRGGGGGRGGGGRRSDLRLKHDVVEVGRLANGIGIYRFVYNGGHTTYVGVIAQEVQNVMPAAITQGTDGYLRVRYNKLGLKFQTYRAWLQNGGQVSLSASVAR